MLPRCLPGHGQYSERSLYFRRCEASRRSRLLKMPSTVQHPRGRLTHFITLSRCVIRLFSGDDKIGVSLIFVNLNPVWKHVLCVKWCY